MTPFTFHWPNVLADGDLVTDDAIQGLVGQHVTVRYDGQTIPGVVTAAVAADGGIDVTIDPDTLPGQAFHRDRLASVSIPGMGRVQSLGMTPRRLRRG